jgi:hypothetical protein
MMKMMHAAENDNDDKVANDINIDAHVEADAAVGVVFVAE